MENPTTPPTSTTDLEAQTPEDGLVAPLTIREIESWTQHSWDLMPIRTIAAAIDAANDLLDDVSDHAGQTLRVHVLLEWLYICLNDALVQEENSHQ